ncbi:MAG: Ada metal-binding domain-containing protein [Sphingobacteriales bacterium]
MIRHNNISNIALRKLIRQQKLMLGGNEKLKIYGVLHCRSGKRMKRENRVFFTSEKEAIINGYRPCGNCMKKEYSAWKNKPR